MMNFKVTFDRDFTHTIGAKNLMVAETMAIEIMNETGFDSAEIQSPISNKVFTIDRVGNGFVFNNYSK